MVLMRPTTGPGVGKSKLILAKDGPQPIWYLRTTRQAVIGGANRFVLGLSESGYAYEFVSVFNAI